MFAFELIFLNFSERLFYETLCWWIKWWTMCEIHPFQRHVTSSIWNIHKVYAKSADVTSVCNFKSLLVTIVHKTVHSETAHGPFQKIRFMNYSCQTPTNFRFTTSITSGRIPIYTMTSSNGNTFRLTGPLFGDLTGHRRIPLTKARDAELWYFLWSAP